jgi:phage head maturation protease
MGQTLRISKDDDALRYDVDIPDTVAGRDTATYIKRGDIRGSSFAFVPDYGTINWIDRSDEKKLPIREIHDIAVLFDVSPVINPAYPSSSAGLREQDEDYPVALRELHQWRADQAKAAGETQKQIDERAAQELNLKARSTTLMAIHSHNKQKQ